jgi:hypothetical protein
MLGAILPIKTPKIMWKVLVLLTFALVMNRVFKERD